MKFQKLDQKQVPQVIILGILTAGFLGWAGFQWIGAAGSAQAQPASAPGKKVASADPGDGAAAGQAGVPGQPGAPVSGQPGQPLPNVGLPVGGYNPDPFRAPANLDPADKPVVKPSAPAKPEPARWPGSPGPLPGAGNPEVVIQPGGPTLPVEPPAPVRPTLTVTGIIDVDGGHDMALVEMNQQQRIVQVGDLVDSYRVKKIDLSGVVLVHGKDRFHASLASTEGNKG